MGSGVFRISVADAGSSWILLKSRKSDSVGVPSVTVLPGCPGFDCTSGITSGSEARREVILTLKNKLSVVKTKAGDAIATTDENKISSLDIYVFGSTTENGTYTYQERFSYRESSAEMPSGSSVSLVQDATERSRVNRLIPYNLLNSLIFIFIC